MKRKGSETRVVLLGPQRHDPNVNDVVASIDPKEGRIAVVTAGWEERESDDDELEEHLHRRAVNLELFARTDDVFERDPELFAAMRARHDALRELQDLYRVRLSHALDAARELLARPGDGELVETERAAAIDAVRDLDAHHLQRTIEVQAEFEERWRPMEREHVARHRSELESIVADASVVCVAGGHVAILLNRMRLFDAPSLFAGKPVVAWSAGAMALSERVVLFHDSPPQGAGDTEILQAGLGVCRGIVPLPHASRRLMLDDPVRVGLFARRFGPDVCVALDPGARVSWDGEGWHGLSGTERLSESGALEEVAA